MTAATVTRNRGITIPKNVLEALGVAAGDRIEFVEVEAGRFEFFAATRSVTELKGMFGKPKRTVSIAKMNAVIAAGGARVK
jgi:antitoxin PrlF